MAEEKVIAVRLEVDNGDSVKQIEQTEQAVEGLNSSFDSLAKDIESTDKKLAKQLEEVNKGVKKNNSTFAELRGTIDQYKDIAIQAGRQSPIGKQALQDAALLQDKLDDLDREIMNLAADANNLQSALQLGSGVVAGFTAFQSVTALVGKENEDLVKTMVKLQAAQGLLLSIEQIRAALDKETLLRKKIDIVATKALAVAQLIYATAIGTTTGALKLFRLALLATGIGAIVVLIGLLIANFDKVKASVIKFTMAILNMIPGFALIKKLFELFMKDEDKLTKQIQENAIKRAQALNEELRANQRIQAENKKIFDQQRDLNSQILTDIQQQIDLRKADGKSTVALEKEKIRQFIATLKTERELYEQRINLITDELKLKVELGTLDKEQFIETKKRLQETTKLITDTNTALIDAEHRLNVFIIADRRRRREESKKILDKEAADFEAFLEKELEAQKKFSELLDKEYENQRARRKAALEDIEIDLEDIDLFDAIDLEEQEADSFVARFLAEDVLTPLEIFYEQWKLMDKEAKLEMAAQGVDLAQSTLNAFSGLNDALNIMGQQRIKQEGLSAKQTDKINRDIFKRNKALQLAQATIDGGAAIVKALTLPFPLSVVQAAAAATTTAIQLRNIAKTRYQPGASSVSAPTFSASSTSSAGGGSPDPTAFGAQPTGATGTGGLEVSIVEIENTKNRVDELQEFATTG